MKETIFSNNSNINCLNKQVLQISVIHLYTNRAWTEDKQLEPLRHRFRAEFKVHEKMLLFPGKGYGIFCLCKTYSKQIFPKLGGAKMVFHFIFCNMIRGYKKLFWNLLEKKEIMQFHFNHSHYYLCSQTNLFTFYASEPHDTFASQICSFCLKQLSSNQFDTMWNHFSVNIASKVSTVSAFNKLVYFHDLEPLKI